NNPSYSEVVNDFLSYGNIQNNIGNHAKARDAYQEALDISMQSKKFSNAASCSTNLAMLYFKDHQVVSAMKLLEQSFEFLKKDPFPETEFFTRINWLQIAYYEKQNENSVIEMAKSLNPF